MRIVERYPAYFRMMRGDGAWAFLTPLRYALSGLYRLYLSGIRRNRAKETPSEDAGPLIVTVGNIEAGGLGKTPVTLEIADRLVSSGARVVIVTRGYRSLAEKSGNTVILFPDVTDHPVSPDGWIDARSMSLAAGGGGKVSCGSMARVAGDEAVLYAARGIPVVIDKMRSRGIEKASTVFSPTHILLDDAFQRRDVHADISILLLDARRPYGNGRLIPMGTLREPPSAAGRADVVIFTRADSRSRQEGPLREITGKERYYSRHIGVGLFDRDGNAVQPAGIAEKEFIIFSGIARPKSFERTVEETGLSPFISFRFMDHHRYVHRDIDILLENAPEGAVYVTTEKDMGKVRDIFPAGRMLLSLRIVTEIEGIEKLIDRMTGPR